MSTPEQKVFSELFAGLRWAISQMQGESGAGESYWEQIREYRAAQRALGEAESMLESAKQLTLSAHPTTEADVIAFVRELREKARAAFPALKYVEVSAGSWGATPFTLHGTDETRTPGSSWVCVNGKSFAEAVVAMREKLGTPETNARKKREEAARLIAEADALEAKNQIKEAA